MKKNIGSAIRQRKWRACAVAVLVVLMLACASTAIVLSLPSALLAVADDNGAIYSQMQGALADYTTEQPITVDGSILMDGTTTGTSKVTEYVVKSGQSIRFVAKDDNAKLTFKLPLKVEAEARVIFDVETAIEGGMTVNGTVTVNQRMYNASAIVVDNEEDPNAEVASLGLIVAGSLNNNAQRNGTITVNDGATLETAASTETRVHEQSTLDGDKFSNNDGGTLMLKAGEDSEGKISLGLTVNGSLVNNGSVIYDSAAAKPAVTSGNPAVSAAFVAPSASAIDNPAAGTYVLYSDSDVTVNIGSSVALSNAVNLLSFGKVTFKNGDNNINYTITADVSLGGGVLDGVTFTQGKNELIFDGGATWTKTGEKASDIYGNISTNKTIFYDNGSEPQAYVYSNTGFKNSSSAFFSVSAGNANKLSMYGGIKITNYEMSGGAGIGGGVGVSKDATFNMYGGEISWCGVTGNTNGGSGAGISAKAGTVNIFGGAVTHNAAATYIGNGSADGAGIAISAIGDKRNTSSWKAAYFNMYGGEISYNHGAVEWNENGADGGGIMFNDSYGKMFGGEIRGNYTGGAGGGVGAWNSDFEMYGGTIAGNHAVYGGGIGAVGWNNQKGCTSTLKILGGSVEDNNAYQNMIWGKDIENGTVYGGDGGGICVGSNTNPTNATIEIGEGAVISGNSAYRGGGLAVYATSADGTTNIANQLIMKGGLISGNAAYTLKGTGYYDTYEDPLAQNGGGVFVSCDNAPSKSMLILSGDASIDSSNTVSFDVAKISTDMPAPISVDGTLDGSGLGALVYLGNPDDWTNNVIISDGAPYLNKFVLDSSSHSFAASGNDIVIGSASGIARVGTSGTPTTLKQALANVPDGGTIEILKSATLTSGQLTIDKNVTIRPASGLDVTLIIAGTTEFTTSDNALFYVAKGGSLTFNSNGGRLTIDGNGMGRILEKGEGNVKDISLVYVNGGSFTMGEANGGNSAVYLRNNITGSAGSAVTVSSEGGTFTMNGGVIEDNTSTHANGSAVFMGAGEFSWNGGSIADNLTSNQNTQANYGVYLSSSQSLLRINGKIDLTDNVLYVGTSSIYAEDNFASEGGKEIGILLADASALTVNSVVVYGKNENVSLFKAHNAAGVTLHPVTSSGDYTNNIVIYKTTTYLFDSRNESNVSLSDGANLADLIKKFLASDGVTQFKTRDHNRVLAITISSTGAVPALNASGASISDLYSRTGYTLMSWTDNGGISVNWNGEFSYAAAPDGATLYPVWQANDYNLTFNGNAPAGASLNGDAIELETIHYSDGQKVQLPANNHTLIGYAFAGWTNAQGNAILFTDGDELDNDDLNAFNASTAIRGLFELTVYAKWLPLFADNGGVGASSNPFVINTIEHLQHLKDTVNGDVVTLSSGTNDVTYYNVSTADGVSYAPNSYNGFYFTLGGDIAVDYEGVIGDSSDTPFSGVLDGQLNLVTLNGEGLFGYVDGAQINNIVLQGAVNSSMQYVGALAGRAVDSRITVIGANASVTSSAEDAVVGGIIGLAVSTEIRRVFNHGAIGDGSVATAGGLVGKFESDDNFIYNSYNTGSVTASTVAGGIAGIANDGTLIQHVFNGGNVNAGSSGVIGAIAGNGQGVNLLSTYYNTDKTYSASPVKAVGNAEVTGSTALPSSQMAVYQDAYFPRGMTLNTLWVCKTHSDVSDTGDVTYFYYPQLKDFAEFGEANSAVRELSRLSAQLTIPDPDDDKNDKPLTPEQFKVIYNLDGGAFNFDGGNSVDGYFFNGAETVKYYDYVNGNYNILVQFGIDAKVPVPANPSKTGYTFKGWYSDEGFTVEYDFDGGVSAADIVLYAKWEATEYRITYELNGGTPDGNQPQQLVSVSLINKDTMLSLDAGQPEDLTNNPLYYASRPGYFFTNWVYIHTVNNTQTSYPVDKIQLSNGDDGPIVRLYYNNSPYEDVTIQLSALGANELRFGAQWQAREYVITYKYIDAKGNPLDDVIDVDLVANNNPKNYTIESGVSLAYASLTGYDFKGWRVLNGTEYVEVNGIDVGNYGDRTFYGVLDAIMYDVTFSTGAGRLDISKQPVGAFTLDADAGYYFIRIPYGAIPAEYLGLVFDEQGKLTVTAEGSTFNHWSTSRTEDRPFDLTVPYNTPRSLTVHAVYDVQTFTVTVTTVNPGETPDAGETRYFNEQDILNRAQVAADRGENVILAPIDVVNGRCQSYQIIGVEYGKSAYHYLVSPVSSKGKPFTGWNGLEYVVEVREADKTVIATFQPPISVIFTNTFISDADKRVQSVSIDDLNADRLNELQPAVKGYTFSGWVGVNGDPVDVLNERFVTVTLLFAVYIPVDVTVNFVVVDPLKGEDGFTLTAPESITVPYNQLFGNLPDLTRVGYVFNRWYAANGDLISANTEVSKYAVEGADNKFSVTLYANNWTEQNYTIKLSAGIGITSDLKLDSDEIPYTYKDTVGSNVVLIPCDGDNTMTREGHTLTGWYLDGELLETLVKDGVRYARLPQNTDGNFTLTAKWDRKVVQVVFDAGAGSFTVPEGSFDGKYYADEALSSEVTQAGKTAQYYAVGVLYGSGAVAPQVNAQAGYAFSNWNRSFSNVTAEITVAAVYVKQNYKLYLSANGGTFADGRTLISSDKEFEQTIYCDQLTQPSARVGYTFAGWEYVLNGENKLLSAGESIAMPADNLTLSVKWEIATYEITISNVDIDETFFTDALGDKAQVTTSGTDVVLSVKHGTDLSALNKRPTKTVDGKSLTLVWKTGNAVGSGDIYIFSTASGDVTLHAEWISEDTGNVVNVRFDYNDGETASQTYPYGTNSTVVFPTPVRLGYTFTGWYDRDNNRVDLTTVTTPATGGETIVYAAQWTPTVYNITYVTNNGADVNGTYKVTDFDNDGSIKLLTLSKRVGYAFDGWFTDSACKNKFDPAEKRTGDVTLFAGWTIKRYVLNVQDYYVGGINLPAVTYGGDFSAWNVLWTRNYYNVAVYLRYDSDNSANNVPFTLSGTALPALDEQYNVNNNEYFVYDGTAKAYVANVTVVYVPVNYQITYSGASGEVFHSASYNVKTYVTVEVIKTAPEATTPGMSFKGWGIVAQSGDLIAVDSYKVVDGANVSFLNGGSEVGIQAIGAINFRPIFEIATYNVTFDGNGASGSMSSQQFVYNTAQTLTRNSFTRVGYTFLGWARSASAKTPDYSDEYELTFTSADTFDVTLYAVWQLNVYKVYFDLNGGFVNSSNVVDVKFGEKIPLLTPAKTGSSFLNWTSGSFAWTSDQEVILNEALLPLVNGNMITLTAQWKAKQSQVTFELNGGVLQSGSLVITVTYGGEYGALPIVEERDGYVFEGWFTASGAKIESTTTVTITSDQVLYAKWTATEYTVTLVYDNNPANNGTVTYTAETVGDVTLPAASRDGYDFLGWFTAKEGGEQITSISLATGNITLYARFAVKSYTVTLNANGGSLGANDATVTVTYGGNYAGKLPALTRTGYIFDGWFTANGDKIITVVTDDEPNLTTVTIAGDHVLYAHWTAKKYTVTFTNNFDSTVIADVELSYGGVQFVELRSLSQKGYVFNGWTVNGDETKAVRTGSVYLADIIGCADKDGVITFTTSSDVIPYSVTYVLGGGTNDASNPATYDVEKANITLADASRTGYTFVGWFNGEGDDATQVTTIDTSLAVNVTLYAKWSANTVAVTFDVDGGSSVSGINVTFGSPYGQQLPVPTKNGYTFVGWFTQDGADDQWGSEVTADTIVAYDQAHVLYAQWTPTTYTITYLSNGGTFADGLVSADGVYKVTYTVEKRATLLADSQISLANYGFAGWSLNNSVIKQTDLDGMLADVTLVAQWNATEYTIELDANGGALTGSTVKYTVETSVLTLPVPSRANYTFDGWYKTKNANGTLADPFDAGTHTAGTIYNGGSVLTLYAKWTAVPYRITLNNNGEVQVVEYSAENKLELPILTRTGYTFGGWYTDKAFTNAFTYDESDIASHNGTIVYAKWTAIACKVTINAGTDAKFVNLPDGYEKDSDGKVVIEQDFDVDLYSVLQTLRNYLQHDEASEVHNFFAWYVNGEAMTDFKVDGEMTITAEWRVNTVSVTLIHSDGTKQDFIAHTKGTAYSAPDLSGKTPPTGYQGLEWQYYGGNTPYENNTVLDNSIVLREVAITAAKPEVTLDTLGGTLAEGIANKFNPTYGELYEQNGALPVPVRAGYTFNGWWLADGTTSGEWGSQVTAETLVANAAKHSLFARWTPNTYVVSFVLKGGNGTGTSSVTNPYDDGVTVTLPTLTKTGYGFAGWYLDAACEGARVDFVDGNTVTVVNLSALIGDGSKVDVTLYAKWNAIEYKVYVGNATDPLYTGTLDDTNQSIELTAPSIDGYTFNGWALSNGGTVVIPTSSTVTVQLINLINLAGSGVTEIRLYSDVVANDYTVTLNANGGSLGANDATVTVTYGSTYADKLPALTRTGYTFLGWYDADDRKIITVVTDDEPVLTTVTTAGNHTLYAKWTANSVQVTFDANGGNFGTDSDDKPVTEQDKDVTFNGKYILPDAPARQGYDFVGWFTAVEDGDRVTSETTVAITQKQTLYAHWNAKSYVVGFDLNGGASDSATAKTYVYGAKDEQGNLVAVVLPVAAKTGYAFGGWSFNGSVITDESVELSALVGLITEGGSLITLQARWTPKEYTVKVDGVTVENGVITFSDAATVTLPTPENASSDGYSFLGWSTDADGKNVVVTSDVTTVLLANLIAYADENNVINLYVVNPANVFTVTFDANGGNLPGGQSSTVNLTYDKPYGQLPAPTRTGYDFDGWYTSDGTSSWGELVTASTKFTATGNQTLYAKWTVQSYVVTLDANGGSLQSGQSTITVRYNQPYGQLPTPIRTGYDFIGWFTQNGANGGVWGAQVTAETTVTVVSDTTVYARWSIINYTVTYVLNGGTGKLSDVLNVEINSVTLQTDVSRLGYTFAGWYDNAEFSGNPVTSVTYDASNASDVSVYAKWIAIEYSLVYDAPLSGSDNATTVRIDQNNGRFSLPTPQPNGNQTYSGWKLEGYDGVTYLGTVSLAEVIDKAVYNEEDGTYVLSFKVVWSDPVFVITYNLPSDVTKNPNPRSCKRGASVNLLPAERTDYVFVGWYTDSGFSGEALTTITPSDDVVLYAKWTPKAYAVTVAIYGWTYGDKANTPVCSTSDGGNVSRIIVEYAVKNGSVWTTNVPANAGDYVARAYYLYADGETGASSNPISFTIAKKSVTVTISANGVYGDELAFNPETATVVYDELVTGDNASAITLDKVVFAAANGEAVRKVGMPYAIIITELEYTSANYVVTAASEGHFYNFGARPVTVTISNASSFYRVALDLSDVSSFVKAELAYGDDISALGITLSTSANRLSDVGSYVISASYDNGNYDVTFVNGVHTVVPLNVALVISEVGGTYGGDIKPASIIGVTTAVAGVTAEDLQQIKSELSGKFTFFYTGATFGGEVYGTPNVTPSNAGVYYAAAIGSNVSDNYNVTSASVQFRIEKAQNVITGDLTIKGWMYNATPNAPTGCSALDGEVIYTYCATANGTFTTTVPTSVGTYYVRAEVAESDNYKSAASSAVSFEISKAVLNAPQAVIIAEGEGRNVEYTGDELRLPLNGFNPTLMLISYDGQTIVDGSNVAVAARNAGTYVIKVSIVDTANYAWASDVQTDEDGNVVITWIVSRKKIAVLTDTDVVFEVTGEYVTYLPAGFDESIMNITGNREAFGGKYTAVITLKDSANYEWSEDVTEVKIEWRMDGIHKAFVIIVSTVFGLAAIGGGCVGVQYLLHARKKRLIDREIDQRSSEDESDDAQQNDEQDEPSNDGEQNL